MSGLQSERTSFHELLDEHHDLMRRIAEVQQFGKEVCELGQGPRYEELADHVAQVRDLLKQHFATEEKDGYFANVLNIAPQFSEQVAELSHQHAEFLKQLDQLTSSLRSKDVECWDSVCSRFDAFVEALQLHEHEENKILQTAFNQDIGAGD